MSVIFDIETGPLPLDQLQQLLPPFDRSTVPNPGEFDPEVVKLGNVKDQAKIDEKIAAAREKHEQAVRDYANQLCRAEEAYWQSIQERAALSAVTGQVVAIGYQGNKTLLRYGVSERAMLIEFWKQYRACRSASRPMVGFNTKSFDVPFLAQRSWILGVGVPPTILTATGYLDSTFVDLRDRWQCGNRWGGEKGYGTLDVVCRSCGLPGKADGCDGVNFAAMLASDDDAQREVALDYLRNDLAMTSALADRLGVS